MDSNSVILLVEDDANDAFFLERALREIGYPGSLRHLTDTAAARAYLAGAGPFSDRAQNPLPALLIADSAISGAGGGVELIEWMRASGLSPNIPCVILSGGLNPETRSRAQSAGVHRILTKAGDFKETAKYFRALFQELPPAQRHWLR